MKSSIPKIINRVLLHWLWHWNWKSILSNAVLTFSIFQKLANKTNLVAKEETWKESDLEDTGDSHQILGKAGIANTVRVVANKIISSSGRNK